MADAMDWHPTTPPTAHNPYSNPHYMPGGWPMSPPAFRVTAGVFARKRESTCVQRVAKRVCTGLKVVGSLALLPAKPVYLIIRHFHRRQHRERRRPAQSSTRSRPYHSPALRAQIEAAERQLELSRTNAQSQPVITAPSTPSASNSDITSAEPAVTGSADTRTTTQTSTLEGDTKGAGVDNKGGSSLKRSREFIDEYPDLIKNHQNTQEHHNNQVDHSRQKQKLDTPPAVKKMKRPNRFNANYKFDPTAYAGRGASPGMKTNPIGVKAEVAEPTSKVFGGWTFEKPIEISQKPGETAPEQSQNDSESHTSEKPIWIGFQHREARPVEYDAATTIHDPRWESSGVLEQFFPHDYYEMDDTSEDTKPTEADSKHTVIDGPCPHPLLKVLEATLKLPIPEPPIRERPFTSALREFSLRSRSTNEQYKRADTKFITTSDNKIVTIKSEGGEDTTLNDDKNSSHPDSVTPAHVGSVKTEDPDTTTDTKKTLQDELPATPLKVVAVKPAKVELETPAVQLSNLSITEAVDDRTPKATPHSGTKTVRVTRYQKLQEEARKAKLEQYELVSISNEWDQKVRHAVRNGIPEYLTSGDLARVAPQYAARGQDNWLNDETINKYLEIVAAHGRKNDRPGQVPSYHAFNNFFYNTLRSKGPEGVLRWSKRAKVGGKNLMYVEKIFVPINSGAHWTLAVVEPTKKTITHYNSMRGAATGIRACEDLKKWVAVELGCEFKEEEWTLVAAGQSPQQTNSDDCGVFTITSARQIMLGLTPMSYGPAHIPKQRIRIVAELINKGLLRSTADA